MRPALSVHGLMRRYGAEGQRLATLSCIDPQDLDKVFQPYFTTKEAGIGLGLAITERIIKEHGGSLAVESRKGEGTTFTVNLPMAKNA